MPYAKPNETQHVLFGEKEPWAEEWVGMPEYEQKNLLPLYSVRINFMSIEDMRRFAKLIEQPLTSKTASVWYPLQHKKSVDVLRYVDEA
jgi:hypothetical protein